MMSQHERENGTAGKPRTSKRQQPKGPHQLRPHCPLGPPEKQQQALRSPVVQCRSTFYECGGYCVSCGASGHFGTFRERKCGGWRQKQKGATRSWNEMCCRCRGSHTGVEHRKCQNTMNLDASGPPPREKVRVEFRIVLGGRSGAGREGGHCLSRI